MAAENRDKNPIIVEPAASSSPQTPPTHLTPSLYASSSCNSFDSSRPQSRGSTATTPSESSSPNPSSAYSNEVSGLSPLNILNLDHPTSDTIVPTASVPSEPAESSSHRNGAARAFLRCPNFTRRRWLEHALGVFTLVASLVGLLFIGVRTYKLAVISTENSTLDGCTGLIQAGIVTLENSTQLCKTAMKNGPLSSPYHLYKRTLHSSLALASRWTMGSLKQNCGFPYIGCQILEASTTYRKILTPSIIISTTLAFTTLALGGFFSIVARRNARSAVVFRSPARSDIQITHHDDSGHRTVTGQGVIEKRNSEDRQDLGQLRQRIQASQDPQSLMKDTAPLQVTDSSSTTSVDSCIKPQVSLENRSSGEKNEGLVELQVNANTKAFLKLETGEFFHVKHWQHEHNDDSGSSSGGKPPLSIEGECFPQKGPVASALAKGKAVRNKCIGHATHQAGDCLAGLMTNEYPTGKPQLI